MKKTLRLIMAAAMMISLLDHAALAGGPTISIVSPMPGAVVGGLVPIHAQISGPVRENEDDVRFYITGFPHALAITPISSPTWTWDTLDVPNGNYELIVKIQKGLTVIATSTPVIVNVNNLSVRMAAPASQARVSGPTLLRAEVSGNNGVRLVSWFQNGTLFHQGPELEAARNFTTYSNGPYDFHIEVEDLSGRRGRSPRHRLVVDNVVIHIENPPSGSNVSRMFTILVSAGHSSLQVARVNFYRGTTPIGTDTTRPYTCDVDPDTLPVGRYDFTAKAETVSGAGGQIFYGDATVPVIVNRAPNAAVHLAIVSGSTIPGNRVVVNAAGNITSLRKVRLYRQLINAGGELITLTDPVVPVNLPNVERVNATVTQRIPFQEYAFDLSANELPSNTKLRLWAVGETLAGELVASAVVNVTSPFNGTTLERPRRLMNADIRYVTPETVITSVEIRGENGLIGLDEGTYSVRVDFLKPDGSAYGGTTLERSLVQNREKWTHSTPISVRDAYNAGAWAVFTAHRNNAIFGHSIPEPVRRIARIVTPNNGSTIRRPTTVPFTYAFHGSRRPTSVSVYRVFQGNRFPPPEFLPFPQFTSFTEPFAMSWNPSAPGIFTGLHIFKIQTRYSDAHPPVFSTVISLNVVGSGNGSGPEFQVNGLSGNMEADELTENAELGWAEISQKDADRMIQSLQIVTQNSLTMRNNKIEVEYGSAVVRDLGDSAGDVRAPQGKMIGSFYLEEGAPAVLTVPDASNKVLFWNGNEWSSVTELSSGIYSLDHVGAYAIVDGTNPSLRILRHFVYPTKPKPGIPPTWYVLCEGAQEVIARIYSIAGQLLSEQNLPRKFVDGEAAYTEPLNVNLAAGVYFYTINVKSPTGDEDSTKGKFALIE